jgi:formylglycine-generating enzyme required for sulfatase activity
MMGDAEQMQSIRVAGLARKDVLVDADGRIELPRWPDKFLRLPSRRRRPHLPNRPTQLVLRRQSLRLGRSGICRVIRVDPPKHYTNSLGMKFVWIPSGAFMMGSPKQELERKDNETQHKVTLTKGFYMSVYTVTQGLAMVRGLARRVLEK